MLEVPAAESLEMSAGFGVSTSYRSSVSGMTLLLSLFMFEDVRSIPEFGRLFDSSLESLELVLWFRALSKILIFASLVFDTVIPTL